MVLARVELANEGKRWRHTQAVAICADELATAVPVEERELLVMAAWLHDLGYASHVLRTGLHQLDGARYLEGAGWPVRLCALVAHHSAAMVEAEERGLGDELAVWPREESAVSDALWMADMTTGPRGDSVTYPERLAEILDRYGADSIVGRAMTGARPAIEAAIARTERRLAAAR
jgi:hypothetical protein